MTTLTYINGSMTIDSRQQLRVGYIAIAMDQAGAIAIVRVTEVVSRDADGCICRVVTAPISRTLAVDLVCSQPSA